jgi:sialic acid synthase SpsE
LTEPHQTPRITIIAEMAWAHNGDPNVALGIVNGAKRAGADALGIHLTSLPHYMVRHYRCVDGVTTSDRTVSEIYRYLEKLSLDVDAWTAVFRRSEAIGLPLCVMCNDEPSLELAVRHDPAMYALAAACFTELEFVRNIGRLGKPVILRIGGATLGEIEAVIDVLRSAGAGPVTLLHGIQLYPTGVEHLTLSAIPKLRQVFRCPVGLADHVDGGRDEALYLPLLAVPMGAAIIEKHITIDRALKHEDFEAALGVDEFQRFVAMVRLAEQAIGQCRVGELTEGDLKYRRVSRKRAVARREIPAGTRISESDIAFKRSDSGVDPSQIHLLVGRTASRNIAMDEGLEISSVTAEERT